ncbi:dCTP deaminase [Halobacteriales archaeon SW_5_70_135]|nr:MAG: dCTP deaminase [Halobacteriales archaeon SW_5_70_135]
MILSDREIRRRLEEGDLDIAPLADPALQVQPASVDLRLGREFLEFQHTNIPYIHPDSDEEVAEYVDETVVPEDGEFVLHPGDFVLGTTVERVDIPDDLIAHVEGRSSLGRLAVVIHASLPYDEEVLLWTPEEGFGYFEIGAVVEEEPEARAVSFDPRTLRVNTHRITDYITNPTRRIYEVRLGSGRAVHVTEDHNLFTIDEHGAVKRVPSEAAEGQFVMVPDSLPDPPAEERRIDLLDVVDPDDTTLYASDGFGTVNWSRVPDGSKQFYESADSLPMPAVGRPETPDDVDVAFKQSDQKLPRHVPLSREFGWALGFYVAEGFARRTQIQVGNTERDHLDRFAAFFRHYDTSLSWNERDEVTVLTVCSALWSRLFRDLAGTGAQKTVPARALNWSDEVLDGLLDGLLDGDGCRRDTRNTLYTTSEDLANAAAYLGTRLGRPTSMYARERENHIPMSDVAWEGTEWAVDFYERDRAHKRGQYVPNPSALLRTLRNESGMTTAEAADAMGYASPSSVSNVENEEYRTVKRTTLSRMRDAYREHGADTTRLDQLLAGGVRFERVTAVERTDRVEPTYDLEVQPDGRRIENFVGGRGGVFLSNTAGLCDPGYRGQITLELSNLGAAPVALSPGTRISQVTFTELTSPAERPYGAERGSKYQGQEGPQASRIGGDDEFDGDQTDTGGER